MKYVRFMYTITAVFFLYTISLACDMKIYPPACLPKQMARKPKEEKKKDEVNYLEIAQTFTPSNDPKVVFVGKSATGALLFHVMNWGIIKPSYYVANIYPDFYVRRNKGNFALKASQEVALQRRYPVVQSGILIKQDTSVLVRKAKQDFQEQENTNLSVGCAIS